MLRKLWAIITVDFKNEFSYPATWIFFLVLPIVFTLIIGAALGGDQNTSDDETPRELSAGDFGHR